ncbi:MAG TPA: cobalamin-independent methionine synthase II family protein [Acidimicrobiales bacterium]|nr:cobalamin-independent methionine synthase II family protein [Acidimicrobiales bacterium]
MAASYRAEVVGSLLRSPALKQARASYEAGRLSAAAFKRIEDRSVDDAIALQEEAGVDVVTDGELRRSIFIDSVAEAVEGITRTPEPGQRVVWHGEGGSDEQQVAEWTLAVTGRVRPRRSLVTEEFVYARARAARPVKVTLVSPMTLTLLWHPRYTPSVYPDTFELYEDLAVVTRAEVEALAALGCTYIQIDAPDLAKLVDEEGRRFFADAGADPDRILTDGVDLLNRIVEGVPGVTFGIHLCRGNSRGRWRSSGGYEAISKAVFRRATAFQRFLLEYDDERSGSFEPLADLPDDKVAVLGLVTTKRPELERTDALLRRIDEAARHFAREQLAISPQCGFASEIAGNPLSEADQRAKLKLVAEVARLAWP